MEEELSSRKTKEKAFNNKDRFEKNKISDKTRNIIFNLIAICSILIMAIAVAPKTMQNDTYYNIKCRRISCSKWNFWSNRRSIFMA